MNLKKYATGIGCQDDVLSWIDTVLSKQSCTESEAEHILDFMASDKRPRRISKMSFEQAQKSTEKWVKTLQKKGSDIVEIPADTETVLDFGDGFKIVKLVGENSYKREGFLMRHCVSSYFGQDDEIYSLRDKKNEPHATFSMSSEQIKGKGNGSIDPKYIEYCVQFLEHVGIEVRDSEMQNLGYVNLEKVKDDFDFGELFQGKYFYKKNLQEIPDKDDVRLWEFFDIFEFDEDLKISYNFDFKKSLENFKKKLEKIDSETFGDYAKIGAEDYAKIRAGNYSNIGAGYNAKVGAGNDANIGAGYNAKIGAGNYSNIGTGNYSNIGAGYNAKVGAGNDANIGAGYNANIGAGNYANIGAGYNAKVGAGYNAKIGAGDYANIECGCNSIVAMGNEGKIKAKKGTVFIIAERDDTGDIFGYASGVVDGKKIKEDTWYTCQNGKLKELKENA